MASWLTTLSAAVKAGWAFVSGAGSIAGAVTEAAKAVEVVTAEVHDANQRTAGANQVVAADLKSENEFDQKVLETAVNPDRRDVVDVLRRGDF